MNEDGVMLEIYWNTNYILKHKEKLKFWALEINGINYLPWSLDIEAHLAAKNL
jgi:hypothetical protein